MRQVIVVGAGASGMIAAISAAERKASVTVLEGMEKPGKKLLLTGNGRCNLTNLSQGEDCYHGGDSAFIRRVLQEFPVEETLRFFRELGLLTCDREGYVYPVTGQASSVLEVLLLEMRRRKIKLKCQEKVLSVTKENGSFCVRTKGWSYRADAVILCAGSMAAPATGSDGSGYALAKSCGHRILPPMEALVPLKAGEAFVRRLSGLRVRAEITLHCRGENPQKDAAFSERGELQFTDYGISGIAVFQLSRHAVRALRAGERVYADIDLMPSLCAEELYLHLCGRSSAKTAGEMLAGTLPSKAVPVLLHLAGISPSALAESLSKTQLWQLVRQIKAMRLTVTGCRSFEQAQVCQGGADLSQIDPETLESRVMPGLYFAGELMDVDGICGGYNLQWAWASGHMAGRFAGGEKVL